MPDAVETALVAALEATAALASKQLVIGRDKARIKSATDELGRLLTLWTNSGRAAADLLRQLLTAARRQCDHAGAQSGYNERDGSWMSPCPTCGDSR